MADWNDWEHWCRVAKHNLQYHISRKEWRKAIREERRFKEFSKRPIQKTAICLKPGGRYSGVDDPTIVPSTSWQERLHR